MFTTTTDSGRVNWMARPHADRKAPVRHLSQERHDRCIIDAARSACPAGMQGSAVAAMIEYSEACYADMPLGGSTIDN